MILGSLSDLGAVDKHYVVANNVFEHLCVLFFYF